MASYVKLGGKAEVFYDAFSELKVVRGQVVEMNAVQARSLKVKKALSGGHLQMATEAEFKGETAEVASEKVDYTEMTKAELLKFYKETYDVSEEEVAEFKSKTKDEMVTELQGLE
jgi:hypothetical protein